MKRPLPWPGLTGLLFKTMALSALCLGFVTAFTSGFLAPGVASAGASVNVYSYRQEFLIRPFLDEFSKQSGISVKVIFAKTGMLQRLAAEGRNSPADVILTVDIARLSALKKAGLTQPVKSSVLTGAIPPQYRDAAGAWFGLSIRARILLASKARVKPGAITRYEDLAKPEWKGRICMRSGRHPYNRALVASMIANLGPEKAKAWAIGLHANLARKPQGNDRAQAKAIFQGLCDIGIANQYYFGKMKFNKKKPQQQEWANAVYLIFPNAGDRGTHVNISGMAMAKHSKNPKAALKLMEFLTSRQAQEMFANINYEYPVRPGVIIDREVASWGTLKPDALALERIAALANAATRMLQEIGFL